MNKTSIDDIIKNVNSVAISGHVRPDGDCVGSCLGLYNYIKDNYPDIRADVYLEYVESTMKYINGSSDIHSVGPCKKADLYISLDTSTPDRIGVISDIYLDTSNNTLCIDHHISNNGYAHTNIVRGGLSSCAEALFYMMDADRISLQTAEALYTGIIHDSGVFKYQSTTYETMNAAGILISKGIDFTKIIDESFYSKTFVQNKILGRAILDSKLMFDGKYIATVISKKTMEEYGASTTDMGGVVEQLRLTEGVEIASFAYETADGIYKVSFRSKNYVDVNEIASHFNGGGHVRAAGATITGNINDIEEKLKELIESRLINS